MKPKLLIALLLFNSLLFAQTITLKLNNRCQTSVLLNNEVLSNEGNYNVPNTGNGITFKVEGTTGRSSYFARIVSLDESGSIDVAFDSSFFKIVRTVATDKDLQLTINNKTYDFSKPFRLTIGCLGNPASAAGYVFQPFSTSTTTPTNSTTPLTNNTPAPNKTTGDVSEKIYRPGSVINDALLLSRDPSEVEREDFINIIKYYFGKNAAITNIQSVVDTNAFLQPIFTQGYVSNLKRTKTKTVAQSDIGNFFSNLSLSSIGGLDVTTIADGAAKFIVKRAKQELGVAFFQKLKNVIDSTPDIRTVFPQTHSLLQAIDNEVYDYEKYIQNLKETFKKDLADIHRNLPGIVDNHPQFFNNHQPVKAALLTACYLAQELENGSHPGDIITAYPLEYLDGITNKSYKGAIETMQLLSASLRDTGKGDGSGYWVSIKKVRELVNERQALKIYLGLLLQEVKNRFGDIPFQNTSLVQALNAVAGGYDQGFRTYNSYRNFLLRLGDKVEALNKTIQEEAAPATSDSARVEKYIRYFRTSVDLIEYATELSRLEKIKEVVPDLPQLLHHYFKIAYAVADLVADINRKNYPAVVNNAVEVYNLVTVRANDDPSLSNPMGYARLTTQQEINFKQDSSSSTLAKLARYGSFMASVATAKNSDEVERAIEAAALPVGSARVKRVSPFNVSLNAYAGLFYGIEKIQGLHEGRSSPNVYGVTAPVGVALSWGQRFLFFPTKNSQWSTSLFLSLIDLGAVAAFRFTDDETEQVPSIQLKHIFSPGAFLSLGIPKSPLSVSFGAQAGPNLRKVKVNANEFDDKFYWRFSTSLAVDIPLFNFHTKSK